MMHLYSAELWSCTGVCSLRGNAQGVADMAKYTVLYYAGTTALSVSVTLSWALLGPSTAVADEEPL